MKTYPQWDQARRTLAGTPQNNPNYNQARQNEQTARQANQDSQTRCFHLWTGMADNESVNTNEGTNMKQVGGAIYQAVEDYNALKTTYTQQQTSAAMSVNSAANTGAGNAGAAQGLVQQAQTDVQTAVGTGNSMIGIAEGAINSLQEGNQIMNQINAIRLNPTKFHPVIKEAQDEWIAIRSTISSELADLQSQAGNLAQGDNALDELDADGDASDTADSGGSGDGDGTVADNDGAGGNEHDMTWGEHGGEIDCSQPPPFIRPGDPHVSPNPAIIAIHDANSQLAADANPRVAQQYNEACGTNVQAPQQPRPTQSAENSGGSGVNWGNVAAGGAVLGVGAVAGIALTGGFSGDDEGGASQQLPEAAPNPSMPHSNQSNNCPTGMSVNNQGVCIVQSDNCPAGQYPDSEGQCIERPSCDSGSYFNDDARTCISRTCPQGQSLQVDGSCKAEGEHDVAEESFRGFRMGASYPGQ